MARDRQRDGERKGLRADLRDRFPRERGMLLPALHYLQHRFGYLPDWAMEVVSWHLGIPASEVYGAATSYSELRIDKPGSHMIRVCTGLSCRISGADSILNAVKARLGVEPGETAEVGPDKTVTLETTACGFLCGVAPALQLDGRWLGRATPERAAKVVDRLGEKVTA